MKKIVLLLAVLAANVGFSQISVIANGKKMAANGKVKFTDLKEMTISFANAGKLANGADGVASIIVRAYNPKTNEAERFGYGKSGRTALEMFLQSKTPKSYQLFPKSDDPTMFKNYSASHTDFPTRLNEYSIGGTPVKVQVTLEFQEILKRDYKGDVVSWAQAVELLDPFVFYVDMTNESGVYSIPGLNAPLSLAKASASGFNSAKAEPYLSDQDTTFRTPNGGTTKAVEFEFTDFQMSLVLCEEAGNNQNALYDQLKTGFENHVRAYANYCNDKIYKRYENSANNGWEALMPIYKKFSPVKYDEKANKGSDATPLWENVTIGKLIGVKFAVPIQQMECPYQRAGSIMPAKKAERVDAGYSIVYLFKHPTNPKMVLAFGIRSTRKVADDAKIKGIMQKAETYFAAINF